jgi:anti-sigma regulatory factor (Ser/Thr protein kinase)
MLWKPEMEDLSLHILDLVENSTAAGATLVEIRIREDLEKDRRVITIADNGRGMSPEMVARVRDPFATTRTTRRVGLGLSLLDQAAREADGALEIRSTPGRGTEVVASFRLSHIDCRPLGDIAATMVALLLGNPGVDFVYESNAGGHTVELDTRELKEQLGDVPLTHPEVLILIRQLLAGGPEGGGAGPWEGGA